MRVIRKRIDTLGENGAPNGFVIPVWSVLDNIVPPEMYARQVYVTAVNPGCIKGPHLHMKRWGMFCCIKGSIKVVTKTPEGVYGTWFSGEHYDYALIQVPPGIGAAIVNMGDKIAYVLNLPSSPYDPKDPDDHAISFEGYDYYGEPSVSGDS